MGDLAGFDGRFDGGLVRCVELEGGVPFLRPGRQEANLAPIGLHEHALQRDGAGAAVVEVGNPIVVSGPDAGTSSDPVLGDVPCGEEFCCVVGEAEMGGVDIILVPADGVVDVALGVGVAGDVEFALAHAEEAIRKDGVEVGVLRVARAGSRAAG